KKHTKNFHDSDVLQQELLRKNGLPRELWATVVLRQAPRCNTPPLGRLQRKRGTRWQRTKHATVYTERRLDDGILLKPRPQRRYPSVVVTFCPINHRDDDGMEPILTVVYTFSGQSELSVSKSGKPGYRLWQKRPDCPSQRSPPQSLNPRILAWERLEARRLEKLGLKTSPRNFASLRSSHRLASQNPEPGQDMSSGTWGPVAATKERNAKLSINTPTKSNSIAPFASLGKPTCGYFFNDRTDHRKKNFGIPPSDLVKWRNFSAN
ncbi:hypothetical protein LSH36_92g02019, partial [Paralvinella palmiformis]